MPPFISDLLRYSVRSLTDGAPVFAAQQRVCRTFSKRAFSVAATRRSADQTRQSYYDLFPQTFADGPPPQSPFTPDLRTLRKEFLQLQAKAHPDLAAPERKRQAEAMSATINEAYKTLQDPLRRARYLLSLNDVDLEDDSMKLSENELLMEVMEAREAVEEVQNEEELGTLKQENQGRIKESVNALEECFAAGDLQGAAHHAIRLRYWNNIEESIHGWEPGEGGGLLHH
ncbi:hypothetical protein AMS68_003475 [Peltaster fructicola]|uniref:J domain-containing protein n=1 Tax=Peltaster fructicola TaxID=286661 RepID=A0A6H0XTL9_9PEZI|nr:hypothetical protein AMS68_003475 [Peltaster fructicola]